MSRNVLLMIAAAGGVAIFFINMLNTDGIEYETILSRRNVSSDALKLTPETDLYSPQPSSDKYY
ncbi:MAG: hypothetical protein V3R57_03300 [Candidatus Bathyarchaeia archaeon]